MIGMIQIKHMCKSYKGDTYQVKALRDINLCIHEGEYMAIMGRSGSGKTTLLNILGFLDVPTSGSFQFQGKEMSKLSVQDLWKYRKNNISFVFQHFALMNQRTVFDNVALPLCAKGVGKRKIKVKVEEQLEKLGISELMNKYPTQISGGQKQRVAIARALVSGNKLLLADEPTGALDYNTGQEIMQIFDEIHKEGTTIILVTHDKNIAQQTQRIVTLQDSQIVKDERRESAE